MIIPNPKFNAHNKSDLERLISLGDEEAMLEFGKRAYNEDWIPADEHECDCEECEDCVEECPKCGEDLTW